MGLFNNIFGNKKEIAEDLKIEDEQRIRLWKEHLKNYIKREELARTISITYLAVVERLAKEPREGIIDITYYKPFKDAIAGLGPLISEELIDINDEKTVDRQILTDFKKLMDVSDIEDIRQIIVYEKRKYESMLKWFQEIYNVLRIELHLIRIIKKRPDYIYEPVQNLFHLIFYRESALYSIFDKERYVEPERHKDVIRIANAVLLQQRIKEEIETDEEKFVKKLIELIGRDEPKHHYKRLAEDIYSDLAEKVGAPVGVRGNIMKAIKDMEKLMKKDKIMYEIVKSRRPKYDDKKIKLIIEAFRQCYKLGHFLDLEDQFAT